MSSFTRVHRRRTSASPAPVRVLTHPVRPFAQVFTPLSSQFIPRRSQAEYSIASIPLFFQAKLTVNAPRDAYEQEADRTAKQVVRKLASSHRPMETTNQMLAHIGQLDTPLSESKQQPAKPFIQLDRQQEALSSAPTVPPLLSSLPRSQPVQPTDEPRQPKIKVFPMPQSVMHSSSESSAAFFTSSDIAASIHRLRGRGQPLPLTIRAPMEQAFGADFSGVTIHDDAEADQLTCSIQARAVTTGQDVFFRRGEYNPSSLRGQEVIAHELTHVVQQNGNAFTSTRSNARPHAGLQAPQGALQRITNTNLEKIDVDWENLTLEEAISLKEGIANHVYIAEAGDMERLDAIINSPESIASPTRTSERKGEEPTPGSITPSRRRSGRKRKAPDILDPTYQQKRGNTPEEMQQTMEQFVRKGKIGEHYSGPKYDPKYYSPGKRTELYEKGEKSSLDVLADLTNLTKNSEETTAVAVSRDQRKIYIANQAGKGTRQVASLKGIPEIKANKYEVIAADEHHQAGLHAEMQIIYYCLTKNISLKSLHAIGVAGGKGACEMCAAILAKLGIGFTFIEKSHYQHLWENPWLLAGKPFPFPELTSSSATMK